MPVGQENSRHSVTLPVVLVDRLKREQGAGQTLSDVLRLKLEQAYAGADAQMMNLTQRVEQVSSEVAVIRAALEQLVGMFEAWVKTSPPTTEPEAPLPVVTYDELYSAPAAPAPMASEVEAPQERTRWWRR